MDFGNKETQKVLSVTQTCSVSSDHQCVGNCSVILEEKLLVHTRTYLKCLLRKEGRKYLDNKLKLSFSKLLLVVTVVYGPFLSLDEPHLMSSINVC